ncbi:hypothetical protein [Streptomyces luteolus]|uniref:Lipocalin-like domain-containing protein n=1 Tax=Streptomyces luteolus TaxID=3043615 RepID=A0ABT6SS70_9ACTN|nr:hypothetical protein [Streptomyces sp. B-S-A12]MDI3418220.1 hypothetical protein [Streptomyces sp. B-S-A12]
MESLGLPTERLVGSWRIVWSTFPMWLTGRRSGATFTYAPLPERGGAARLRDVVSYRARGRERRIVGTDTRLPGRAGTAFRWRGRGVLAPLTSVWEVAEIAEDGSWAVITFAKSLVTPAGIDVVVRTEHLSDPEVMAAAERAGVRLGATRLPA